jgi:ParB/RepB/Spo0J family partition protein
MKTLHSIPLSMLKPSPKARPLKQATVDQIAESISTIGLQQPIIVRRGPVSERGLIKQGFIVVAGHHRYSAALKLSLHEIDAWVAEDESEANLELIEIDENLCRAELTFAQRSASIVRRKELWETIQKAELSAESADNHRGVGRPVSFAEDTARVTGECPRRIREQLARADALGDDLNDVVGTSLDKGVELDALCKLDEDKRKELIARAKAGEEVSARHVGTAEPEVVDDKDDELRKAQATWVETAKPIYNLLVAAARKADPYNISTSHIDRATVTQKLVKALSLLQKLNQQIDADMVDLEALNDAS